MSKWKCTAFKKRGGGGKGFLVGCSDNPALEKLLGNFGVGVGGNDIVAVADLVSSISV